MSATMTADQKAQAVEYKMPPTRVGRIVYWYPGGDFSSQPCAAFVAKVGQKGLCLAVVVPGRNNFLSVDGVRHRSDPEAREIEFEESGCWEDTHDQKAYDALFAAKAAQVPAK